MTSQALAERIVRLAIDKKGKDITIMDLRGITDVSDYFVILSGESDVHVKTVANHIIKQLKSEKIKVWRKEGLVKLNWVLLDLVEVVVHIFRPDTREYYGLERLWADAKMTKVDEDAEFRELPETTH